MTPLARLIFHTVQELAVGSLFCLALLPPLLIRRGFFHTCVLILASAMGLGVWVSPTPASMVFFVSLLLYGGSLWMPDGRWPTLMLRLSLAIGTVGIVLPSLMSSGGPSLFATMTAQVLNSLTSALILGTALIGMLLGHYYLRDPQLPVALIQRLANLFLLATVLQGLFLLVNLGALYLFGGAEAAAKIGLLSSSYVAVFLGRLFVGILGSFILACVIWDTLRIPNVQAATGFFYIAILTVTIGEFLGRYLWHSTSIPF